MTAPLRLAPLPPTWHGILEYWRLAAIEEEA